MTWLWPQMSAKVKCLDALNQLSIFRQLNISKTSAYKMQHTCLGIAHIPFKLYMNYVDLTAIVISLNHLKKCTTAHLVNTGSVEKPT